MFLSKTDQRERDQSYQPLEKPEEDLFFGESSFGETFTAGLGYVIDEELSISSSLNNEGYEIRQDTIKEMADEGFDLTPYQNRDGGFDYDQLAHDTGRIQTNLEIFQARNEELARRRQYSEDVTSRGNGVAQFLGAMNGYMLDPVNVISLPLGASASALRGASTLARIKTVAKTEAAIGAGAELLIQPLVMAHKDEIGSPYEMSDAIAAIGTAAIGSAVIGGASAGIAGYLRNLAKSTEGIDTLEARGARDAVNRQADMLERNPDRMKGLEKAKGEMIYATAFEPLPFARKGVEAWHGTPHKVDKFSSEKIGTGEGAQAYGHGLYFAQAKEVAEGYREALSSGPKRDALMNRLTLPADGYKYEANLFADQLDNNGGDIGKALTELEDYASSFKRDGDTEAYNRLMEVHQRVRDKFPDGGILELEDNYGNLYRVYLDVEEDKLLDWDQPLSEQSEYVQEAIRPMLDGLAESDYGYAKGMTKGKLKAYMEGRDVGVEATGQDLYRALGDYGEDSVAGSNAIRDAGIHGIRYADGMSRGADGGTSNFVIFDDSRIRMEHELENTLLVESDARYMEMLEQERIRQEKPQVKPPEDQPNLNVDDIADQDIERLATIEVDDPHLKAIIDQQRAAAAEQDELIDGLSAVMECSVG